MEQTNTPPPIFDQIKLYLENKIKLLKYEGIDRATAIIAEVITDIIIVVLSLLAFLFISITMSLFAAHLLNSYWEGFGCIALLYVIVVFFARILKISIQNMLIGRFVKVLFKK
ncbi:hypothetical protein AAFN85_23095 [Mucilaginibacter sp. CAU 1740]|uniref:hypothetical protein n=1 Tax=Mucilaginibacter sp. CAU 1740 TaxID=3140365 RepID=UPI00325B4C38